MHVLLITDTWNVNMCDHIVITAPGHPAAVSHGAMIRTTLVSEELRRYQERMNRQVVVSDESRLRRLHDDALAVAGCIGR